MFTDKFRQYAYDGDVILCSVEGFDVTATIVQDDDMGPPQEAHDGHGVVVEWGNRNDKEEGDIVLNADHLYKWDASIRKAKEEQWDAEPYGGTPDEQAARACKADAEYLRRWYRDEWFWCGVRLSISRNGIKLDNHAASLWGIECNASEEGNDYLTEVANDLLPEALEVGRKALDELRAKLA